MELVVAGNFWIEGGGTILFAMRKVDSAGGRERRFRWTWWTTRVLSPCDGMYEPGSGRAEFGMRAYERGKVERELHSGS